MILHLIIFLLAFLAKTFSQSSEKGDFFFIPKGDSVGIFLTFNIKHDRTYDVFRKRPNESFYQKLNSEPIGSTNEMEIIKISARDNWKFILDALNTKNEDEAFRILKRGGFSSTIICLLFPTVAQELGRLFVDTTSKKNLAYVYKIVFYDSKGLPIDSLEKRKSPGLVLPIQPSSISAKEGDRKVTIRWKYPKWKNNYDDLAVQFYVFRKNQKGIFERINNNYIIRDDNKELFEFEDLWLENSKTYSYYIVAVDPLQNMSKPSEIISITARDLTPPISPANLIAKEGDGFIELSWDIGLDLDLKGYNLYRASGLDKKFEKINKNLIPLNTTYYKDESVGIGVQYFYYVTAIDEAQNESEKSNIVNAIAFDKTPPIAPKSLRLKETANKNVEISWDISTSKDVIGYNVYRGDNNHVLSRLNDLPINSTKFLDKGNKDEGLIPGKKYAYAVSAVDKSNNESEKIFAEIKIIDNEPPLPPSNFFAKNYEGRYVEIYCGSSSSLDAAFYEVYRYELEKQTEKNAVKIKTFNSAPLKFRDTTVKKGQKFVYFALAVDSNSNYSKKSLADTVFVRDYSPPPKTRNVYIEIKNKGILIKWEKVIDFDFVGFNIYRSDLPTGIYKKINKYPLKNTEYLDPEGREFHYYKIGSIDTSGNESLSEPYVYKKK